MKLEFKVGLLFLASVSAFLVLGTYLGLITPLANTKTLHVVYNYAGGIDEGSPVRVMGIKVGFVKKGSFDPNFKTPLGEEVKLRLTVAIQDRAWESIREDSKFYINLAGVIGEKFLEISPGTGSILNEGQVVRGEDPPRIDQLISQSYGLAGRMMDLVENNKVSITSVIGQMDKLLINFNRTLVLLDKGTKNEEVGRLLTNAVKISDDLAYLTGQLRSQKSQESFELAHRLLLRLEPLDGPAIREFLQKEGIKAKIF